MKEIENVEYNVASSHFCTQTQSNAKYVPNYKLLQNKNKAMGHFIKHPSRRNRHTSRVSHFCNLFEARCLRPLTEIHLSLQSSATSVFIQVIKSLNSLYVQNKPQEVILSEEKSTIYGVDHFRPFWLEILFTAYTESL